METRSTRIGLGVATVAVVAFLWLPLLLIMAYAFNSSTIQSWPISGFTFHWFRQAWDDHEVRSSLWLSLKVGLTATTIALVLGTAAAAAIYRFRFFGREAVSFLLLLPIALPGIITGMALNSFFNFGGVQLSIWTIVAGHATFCVVIVYNNVIARLRRLPVSPEEASSDLGADMWTTFRRITAPRLGTALLSAALLAFALSFDEIIVTNFMAGPGTQTIPLWILSAIQRPNELPIVNVVALVLILISVLPVWLAQRIAGAEATVGARM